jgi:hypothetical protein
MQVRDGSLVMYQEQMFSRRWGNNLAARNRMATARKGQYSGRMTMGARKRMTRAICLMCQAVKPKWIYNEVSGRYCFHRLSFITLTVSSAENISARMAYDKLLSGFLQWLRKSKGVKCYIWKAELQKRGQIHYHITLPDFIHYLEIRNEWNKLQKAAGLLDEYAKVHGHFNPNSTDIHDVRHVKNLSSYILKELGKSIDAKKLHYKKVVDSLIKAGEISEDQREKILDEYVGTELITEGKIWDCSNNLSGCRYYSVVMTSRHEDLIAGLIAQGDCRKVSGDWWAIMYFNDTSPPDLLSKEERQKFEEHVEGIIREEEIAIDEKNVLPFIPAELVLAEVDTMQTFSIEQMQLNFN